MLPTAFWGGSCLGRPPLCPGQWSGLCPHRAEGVRGRQRGLEAEPAQDVAKGLEPDPSVPAIFRRVRRCPGMLSSRRRDVQASGGGR